jgi:hypothetical protein
MISRSFLAAVCLATSSFAAPPLTTIQDVLFKADGTRFHGTLSISWTSFEAVDRSAIAQQTTTVTVVNGNLQVQLVPTTTATPAAFYTVVYNSDGLIQFQETWAVPSSLVPLRIRDVRVSTVGAVSGAPAPVVDTVQESDIIGLLADLGARPLKGPGYAAGRVAFVNPTGAIDTVTGTLADCVRVDGSSGPCGGTQPNFVDGDTPAGLVDGANTAFTLSGVPSPAASLAMYRNGMLQKPVQDFTLSGNQIQFVTAAAPQPGDTLLAIYRLAGGATGAPQLYPNPQVLCSGLGAATNSSTLASIGTCTIQPGLLTAGDRVEIRFDLDHAGTAGAFSFAVLWGTTTVLARSASAVDAQAAGRADAALTAAGAQLSHQSWGTSLAFAAGVGKSTVDHTAGVTVDFQALTALPAETVTLRNFTVVRFP